MSNGGECRSEHCLVKHNSDIKADVGKTTTQARPMTGYHLSLTYRADSHISLLPETEPRLSIYKVE
jgi:hypothetical protein